MDDPEEKKQNLQLADINPKVLLVGETPRLIDEWQLAPQLWISADMLTNGMDSADAKTVTSHIDALKKIFVIEDSIAWNPNLRSKTAIRSSDTRYYVDPSIGVAALGLGPNDLNNDLNTMGFLFETQEKSMDK